MTQHVNDLLEHQPNGRLLAFDPKTLKSRTLLRDIYFANGVAVSPDQSFVLVAETGKYRVRRVWLDVVQSARSIPMFSSTTSRASLTEFLQQPRKCRSGRQRRDKFWFAFVTPRQALFDRLLPYPFLRKVVYRLPKSFQPAPERYSFVIALDTQGRVIDNLQNGSSDCYAQIANVIEHNNSLYFGSIGEDTVGRFTLR